MGTGGRTVKNDDKGKNWIRLAMIDDDDSSICLMLQPIEATSPGQSLARRVGIEAGLVGTQNGIIRASETCCHALWGKKRNP